MILSTGYLPQSISAPTKDSRDPSHREQAPISQKRRSIRIRSSSLPTFNQSLPAQRIAPLCGLDLLFSLNEEWQFSRYGSIGPFMEPDPIPTELKLMRLRIFTLYLWLLPSVTTLFGEPSSNRFHGPDGSGVYSAPNLPVAWSEDDYLWTKKLPGDGHSSPVVWKGHLYITTSISGEPGSILLCLDPETGDEIWHMSFPSENHNLHQFNTFASATPAVDEHHVYIVWSDHSHFQIAAVDHNGRGVWQKNLGTHHTQHGGGISPLVFEDRLFVQNDCRGPSAIHALNRMTGDTLWKIDRPFDPKGKTSYSTPLLYQSPWGAPQIIFNSTSSGMTAVDPYTGQVAWQLADLFPKRTIMSPIQVGDLLFSSCGDGNSGFFIAAIKPPATRDDQPAIAYQIRKSAPYVPTPVAKDNLLFLVSDGGIATCIDAPTGKEIWKEKLGDTYFSSPIRIDDRIYAVSRRADVVVFKAADQFELLGRTLINQSTHSTPIVADGRLYLRTVSHLYCLK